MSDHFSSSTATRAGTAGGTLLALLLRINGHEILQTMVVSGIGAAVSFSVSVALRWVFKKLKR